MLIKVEKCVFPPPEFAATTIYIYLCSAILKEESGCGDRTEKQSADTARRT